MRHKGLYVILLCLVVGVAYFGYAYYNIKFTPQDNYRGGQQYPSPLNIDKQTIGVSTMIGCLRTSYSDEDLINNKILVEKVIGVPTAQLCYLNG